MARLLLVLALLLVPASPVAAAENRLVDRIVAVVDEDPILASEIERALVLERVVAASGESLDSLERRVLDLLIEQRLRLHELERYGGPEPRPEELEEQLRSLEERLGGSDVLDGRLAELDMEREELEALLALQLRLLEFVRERLGPRVFVGLEEIQQYYDTELASELERRSTADSPIPRPPIEEVREQIRSVLYERELNREIVRWTEELRRRADIRDLLDQPEELPPVVERIEDEGR